MSNFCPNCGAKIREDAKFCASCGQKISDDSSPPEDALPQSNSAEGIVLKSSAPFPSKRTPWVIKVKKFCWVALVGGLVLFFVTMTLINNFEIRNINETIETISVIIAAVGFIGILGGGLGIGVFGGKDEDVSKKQLDELREMKFKFVHDVTADEVYTRLYPALTAIWGEQVTFDRRDEIISVTHNKVNYDISLNDDGTFIVYWHTSLSNTIFSKDWAHVNICRKIRTDTAVIAYELQRQFNITE